MSGAEFREALDPGIGGSGLARTRDSLRGWLREAGITEPDLDEILIATGEACWNAVEHSGADRYGVEPPAWIRVTCDDRRVRVVVADHGRWKEPDLAAVRAGSRGRGRLMMVNLVDHMEIHTGPNGTTVELVKERTQMNDSLKTPVDPVPGLSIATGSHPAENHSAHNAAGESPVANGAGRTNGRLRLRHDDPHPGTVVVTGEIDMANADELRRALEETVGAAPSLIIDLCEVTYLDSAGVSVLFDQAHKDLRIRVAADSAVATVIRICGLTHVADVQFVPDESLVQG
jgi:anti-anti-sigma factor